MCIEGLILRAADYPQFSLRSASERTLRNCSASLLAEPVLANFPH